MPRPPPPPAAQEEEKELAAALASDEQDHAAFTASVEEARSHVLAFVQNQRPDGDISLQCVAADGLCFFRALIRALGISHEGALPLMERSAAISFATDFFQHFLDDVEARDSIFGEHGFEEKLVTDGLTYLRDNPSHYKHSAQSLCIGDYYCPMAASFIRRRITVADGDAMHSFDPPGIDSVDSSLEEIVFARMSIVLEGGNSFEHFDLIQVSQPHLPEQPDSISPPTAPSSSARWFPTGPLFSSASHAFAGMNVASVLAVGACCTCSGLIH
jgi:hypothetical protein